MTYGRLLHAYYACISYTDAQVGKVLDALEKEGLADNTVVILYGDHGYHLGDHGLWNKMTNFDNATRVPLIVSAPGMKKGVKSASMVEFLDIFPTVCELTKTAHPQQLDGKSLVPVLKNPKAKIKDYAMSQYSRLCLPARQYTKCTRNMHGAVFSECLRQDALCLYNSRRVGYRNTP